MQKHKRNINLLWVTIILLLPFPLISTLYLGLPTIFKTQIFPITMGLVGYTWMLSVIYLSTKPK